MRAYWALLRRVALLTSLALLATCGAGPAAEPFVAGLNQPRGMAFDAAGSLLVAEAGAPDPAADHSVQPEVNHSGRVLRIAAGRQPTALVDRLPFTHYPTSGDIGAADVAVLGGAVYVLTGEGYDDELSRAVLRLRPNEPPERVADLLSFAIGTTSLDNQMSTGGVPTNPYAMVGAADGSALYVADGASGRVLRVGLDGQIRVFATLPGMPPLTGMAFGPDSRLYITMFSTQPHAPGSGAIWAADAAGTLAIAASGLTMPIDVGFDAAGAMYVLEFSDGLQPGQPYAAGRGRLLRIEPAGPPVIVIDRLDHPTAMIFSPTGDLYIATGGAFATAGQGAILRLSCQALGVPQDCPAPGKPAS